MTFKDFYIDGKKVKTLFIDGKQVKIGGEVVEGLAFKAVDGSVGLSLTKNGSPDTISLETKLDNGSWNAWNLSSITIPQNSTLYVRRTDDNPTNKFSSNPMNYYRFNMNGSGKVQAQGSVQYLLGKSGTRVDVVDWCFFDLFYNCSSLTQAPELPATTLAAGCYQSMFSGCSSLTQAPELPATTLTQYCYNSMFKDCSSLTQAPELPATTLADSCYSSMFYGCSSLTSSPELPATTLTKSCYNSMFYGCSSLTQAPELPATTLADSCYNSMFVNCKSLVEAPELPATTLFNNCYRQLFTGCTSLTKLKVGFTSWGYSSYWLNAASTTGTFYCPQALIDATTTRDASTVPSGWNMVAI